MEKVLIVDDDKDFAEMAKLVLGNSNYLVTMVSEINSAFKMISRNSYDMIVSNYRLPHCAAVITAARIHNPHCRYVLLNEAGMIISRAS